ncbi:helix-turn-helix transcriptional regulator|uniref:DNA-binding transcriptional regulator, XRE-family HTH domain n=1 Tax=Dendrosporobacter quercicolus TaxID=146817 RepID=A0A1G9ZWQ2_9FIRM|nr:helix-turn-helix transcriptional regulator [Dendrosporobacter quercicolus]NSL49627.1 helix-turn-helix transcriptional regulator [Dendrosporobacter quercicolus DSM 1736]SDN25505.1 DNA-binding transcriptional regulator, XRE-family HTH domain [Dendrosporobacter quercicolus]
MNEIPLTLRNTLRSLRVKFNYTQEEAAVLLGVSTPTLRAWESDSGKMPFEKIIVIEKIYKTPKDYIFFGKESTFSELLRNQAAI